MTLSEAIATVEVELGHPLAEDFADRVVAEARASREPICVRFSGVEQVLSELTMPACVASNGTRSVVTYPLEITGLMPGGRPHLHGGRCGEAQAISGPLPTRGP